MFCYPLKSYLIEEDRSAPATMSGIESVELIIAIQTTPVPDNTSFDVKVSLVYGPNATLGTPGDRISRFDAGGEYRLAVYLVMKDDRNNFDPDIAQSYLQKQTATVIDKTTFSGETVSFTEDFPDAAAGADVCARAYLEFFSAAAGPQPLYV